MELNIFNGDCACDAWRKANGSGPALVWRENYLEGRIPGPDTGTAEFARIRAGELHAMMPELAEDRLLAALNTMDRTSPDWRRVTPPISGLTRACTIK